VIVLITRRSWIRRWQAQFPPRIPRSPAVPSDFGFPAEIQAELAPGLGWPK